MVGNLDCFQLPLTKEGSDVITACDPVYTDKGSHEAVVENALVKLHRNFYYFGLRAFSLFHVAVKVFL